MDHTLNRVAVLGAGTMGAQIAAHFANIEIPTLLLDLPTEGSNRNEVARQAVERLVRMKPPPMYSPEKVRFIEVGNFKEDLPKLSSCDWIIEAIIENLEAKQELWKKVEPYRRPDCVVSTNTSGLPISRIAQDRSEDFKRYWLGTHFFNPPRYLKLLEIIPGPETLVSVVDSVSFIGNRLLGKGIVVAKDRPNFIANRVGVFVVQRAIELMEELNLTIEEVDTLTGPLIGRPKTATFGLADLVGIDVMVAVGENLYRDLSEDLNRDHFRPADLLKQVVARGWTGRKVGQGFYKRVGQEILVLDRKTLKYRNRFEAQISSLQTVHREPNLLRRIQILLQMEDQVGAFLWLYLRDTFLYAAQRIPEITEEYYQIDRAMKWGYNWEKGPFELWQDLGIEVVARRMKEEDMALPSWVSDLLEQPDKQFYVLGSGRKLFFDRSSRQYQVVKEEADQIQLTLLSRQGRVVRSNSAASLLDLGDGVACLEFHAKANTVSPDTVEMAQVALEEVDHNFLGLVIGNQGQDFSMGVDLSLLLQAAQGRQWEAIEEMVCRFQDMVCSFRNSTKPVVSAPFHRTLGGGAEICLGCDRVVAAAESYIGLVEVGVGLIPAGGGTKEILMRHLEEVPLLPLANYLPAVQKAFETIGRAVVSTSAEDARQLRFLLERDSIEINLDRILSRAKQQVVALVEEGYCPPRPALAVPVVAGPGLAALKMEIYLRRAGGYISKHDALVARKLAHVLTGGDLNHATTVPERYLLDLEREAFLSLCGEAKTLHRLKYTLKTGKRLRN